MIHCVRKICKILEGKMRFAEIEASQWKEVKNIYMEAFPKREKTVFCPEAFGEAGKGQGFYSIR